MNWSLLLRRRGARLLAMLVAAVGVLLLLWLRGPSWSRVGHSFTDVGWQWVIASLALNVVSVLMRVLCWRVILLQALEKVRLRFMTVLSAFAIGLIANAILPGRGGEFARVAMLHRKIDRRRGLWPELIGTVIAYRLLDLIPAVLLAGWAVLATPLPGWAFVSLLTVIIIGTAGFLAGIGIARRSTPSVIARSGPVRRWLAFARQGLTALKSSASGALAGAFQTLGWLCQLLAVWTAMRAFKIDLPLSAAALVLVLMNITLILPLWTGNVGLLQAAVALPLIGYGISYSRGFACGIGIQGIDASVGVAYGLGFLAREGIGFAILRETRQTAAEKVSSGNDNYDSGSSAGLA